MAAAAGAGAGAGAASAKPPSLVTVAIVGTSGREPEDAKRLTREVYRAMCKEAERVIRDEWKLAPSAVRLVSGGSAWADHVAVDLFLSTRHPFHPAAATATAAAHYGGLTLFLPAPILPSTSVLSDGYLFSTTSTYGKRLNGLHRAFSAKAKSVKRASERKHCRSITDMTDAKVFGAVLDTSSSNKGGFLARNTRIAQAAQYLLALTWGDDVKAPKAASGTHDTWRKAQAAGCTHLRHVPLATLLPAAAAPQSAAPASSVSRAKRKR